MTYNELKTRFKELFNRRGRGSIKAKDILTLILELIDKIIGIDVSATATVRKSYDTLSQAKADKTLIDRETNKPLKIGQLVSVVADPDISKNAIYRLASIADDGSPTWERQAPLGDMSVYAKSGGSNRTIKEIDDRKLNIEMGCSPYVYSNLPFEFGGIDSDTGVLVTNKVRLRAAFRRKISLGEIVQIVNNSQYNLNYGVYLYLGNTFIGTTGKGVVWITCDGTFDNVKFQLVKTDESEFNTQDLKEAKENVIVKTYSTTDTYRKDLNEISLLNDGTTPILESNRSYTAPVNKAIASKSLWLLEIDQKKLRGKYIESIIIDFDGIGTFSVFKGTDIATEKFKRVLVERFYVVKTGKQRLVFSKPLHLDDKESLGIFDSTDTSSFVYNNTIELGSQNFHMYDSGSWVIARGSLNITIDRYLQIEQESLEFSLGGVDSDTGAYVENDIRLRSERVFVELAETVVITNKSQLNLQYIIYFKGFNVISSEKLLPNKIVCDGSFDNFVLTFASSNGSVLTNSDTMNLRENIFCTKTRIMYSGMKQAESNRYRRKYLSIIGASTNTYSGWIPAGYLTYYPHGSLNSPKQQYWWKLIDYFGMNLLTLNAWSGSRVSSGGSGSISDLGRAKMLHRGDKTPDVIINAGLNDYNNNVPLGDYDGTGEIPITTTTFSSAYGRMVYDIISEYPLADVWCCTLQLGARLPEHGFPEKRAIDGVYKSQFNDTIRSIANNFGVGIIDLEKCGLNPINIQHYVCDSNEIFQGSGLHPNNSGFDLFVNAIKKAWAEK